MYMCVVFGWVWPGCGQSTHAARNSVPQPCCDLTPPAWTVLACCGTQNHTRRTLLQGCKTPPACASGSLSGRMKHTRCVKAAWESADTPNAPACGPWPAAGTPPACARSSCARRPCARRRRSRPCTPPSCGCGGARCRWPPRSGSCARGTPPPGSWASCAAPCSLGLVQRLVCVQRLGPGFRVWCIQPQLGCVQSLGPAAPQ